MKTRFLIIGFVLVVLASALVLPGGFTQHARASSPFLAWTQVASEGFGDWRNLQLPSLEVFGNDLYVGTWRWMEDETQGFQIFRTADGANWELLYTANYNGAADLVVFKNLLYVGTWDGHILRSRDGSAWEEVMSDGFGNYYEGGIARFVTYKGYLYASTWSGLGTDIWRTKDGLNWEEFVDAGLSSTSNAGAISTEIFEDYLYWGVGNWADCAAHIWRTDGMTVEEVVTDGFGVAENCGVSALASFKDYLYASTHNGTGLQIWRSANGTDWEQVPGVGTPYDYDFSGLEVLEGQLYLIAANYDYGAEVWQTANGTEWIQVSPNGFGNPWNWTTYWDNGMTVFKGRLYTGLTNFWSGGEVWMLSP